MDCDGLDYRCFDMYVRMLELRKLISHFSSNEKSCKSIMHLMYMLNVVRSTINAHVHGNYDT